MQSTENSESYLTILKELNTNNRKCNLRKTQRAISQF
jgi:hypothetical protein